ncbi:RanBP3, partial [Drosophila busckii]
EASVETNCFKGGFTLKASRLGGAVLRPAMLGESAVLGSQSINNSNNSSASTVTGSDKTDEKNIVVNPFLREQREDEDASAAIVESSGKSEKSDKDDDEIDERQDPLAMLRNNGIERTNIFAAAKTNLPSVQTSGFIFGQNVHERVIGVSNSIEIQMCYTEMSTEAGTSNEAEATTSQSLFSSVIQKAAQSTDNHKETSEAKSLNDVAREYEESRAQKRKYEEVETFTGEENELNIADVSCKLFAFINSNWEERGRGSLRLNDAKDERDCSRVVFRTSGNLRLVLNTKVWAAMVAERASQKSLRLTAMDNTGTVKIFLAMGRPADIAQVHKALSERIAKRKQTHPEECVVEQTKNGISSGSCAESAQPESTTNDDDDEHDDDASVMSSDAMPSSSTNTTTSTAVSAEADSNEPSPKKALVQADSSEDAAVPTVDVDACAEAEPKEAA